MKKEEIEEKLCNICDKKLKRVFKYNYEMYCKKHYLMHQHYDGKHTKGCATYSIVWLGTVCKYMLGGGKPHFFETDYEKV